jgi:hypothetical protein
VDVLTEIASTFDIELTALFGKHPIPVVYRKEIVVNSVAIPTAIKLITPYEHGVSFLKLVSVQNG